MSYRSPVVMPDGRVFPSQAEACRKLGVTKRNLQYHLNTHGELGRLGYGKSRPNCQNAAKPFRIGPHEWPSRVSAAHALGISISQLNRWTGPKSTPVMREMLLGVVMAYGVRE